MTAPDPDLDFLTTAEVSKLLRKPQSSLRYWRSMDIGPRSFNLGSTVVYPRRELLAWIAEQDEATGRGGSAGAA